MPAATTVVLTGLPGAGKTEAARVISRRLSLPIIDVAEVLRRALERRGCSPRRRGEIGTSFVAAFGREAVLTEVERELALTEAAVIDAIRLPETLAGLRSRYRAPTILVTAPPEVRLARLIARLARTGQQQDDLTAELAAYSSFDEDVKSTALLADACITNGGTLVELEEEVRQTLDLLRIPSPTEHTFYTPKQDEIGARM